MTVEVDPAVPVDSTSLVTFLGAFPGATHERVEHRFSRDAGVWPGTAPLLLYMKAALGSFGAK